MTPLASSLRHMSSRRRGRLVARRPRSAARRTCRDARRAPRRSRASAASARSPCRRDRARRASGSRRPWLARVALLFRGARTRRLPARSVLIAVCEAAVACRGVDRGPRLRAGCVVATGPRFPPAVSGRCGRSRRRRASCRSRSSTSRQRRARHRRDRRAARCDRRGGRRSRSVPRLTSSTWISPR